MLAVREHDEVLAEFLRVVALVPPSRWHAEPAPGKWTAAALTVHISDSYAFGVRAASGGAGMKLRVPLTASFVARNVIFPLMLWRRRFPKDAPAPPEVRPDLADASRLKQADALARVAQNAADALAALRRPAATPVQHAVFGQLSPYQALRMLSAHTRHHTEGMRLRSLG
jgi:hypothetical protein